MAALLVNKTDVGVEEYGRDIVVADDMKARLMYYVHSICSVLDLSTIPNIERLKKYYRYNSLTDQEKLELYVLCDTLSPSLLNNKVIFQDDRLCGYDENKFLRLNVARHNLLISESIVLGGKRVAVKKIMAYKKTWLDWCYNIPIQELRRVVARQLEEVERARRAQRQRESGCNVM
ncbi:hypothetical protein ACF0H5_024059 [Mactra antiquata]